MGVVFFKISCCSKRNKINDVLSEFIFTNSAVVFRACVHVSKVCWPSLSQCSVNINAIMRCADVFVYVLSNRLRRYNLLVSLRTVRMLLIFRRTNRPNDRLTARPSVRPSTKHPERRTAGQRSSIVCLDILAINWIEQYFDIRSFYSHCEFSFSLVLHAFGQICGIHSYVFRAIDRK